MKIPGKPRFGSAGIVDKNNFSFAPFALVSTAFTQCTATSRHFGRHDFSFALVSTAFTPIISLRLTFIMTCLF